MSYIDIIIPTSFFSVMYFLIVGWLLLMTSPLEHNGNLLAAARWYSNRLQESNSMELLKTIAIIVGITLWPMLIPISLLCIIFYIPSIQVWMMYQILRRLFKYTTTINTTIKVEKIS